MNLRKPDATRARPGKVELSMSRLNDWNLRNDYLPAQTGSATVIS
jgi:hypothetical protein